MSYAREMLDSTAGGTDFGAAEVAAAIEACLNCGRACTALLEAEAFAELRNLAGG